MKFSKDFYGVEAGEVYPRQFAAGDECPPELESAAAACGALEADDDAQTARAAKAKAEAEATAKAAAEAKAAPLAKAMGVAPENKAR